MEKTLPINQVLEQLFDDCGDAGDSDDDFEGYIDEQNDDDHIMHEDVNETNEIVCSSVEQDVCMEIGMIIFINVKYECNNVDSGEIGINSSDQVEVDIIDRELTGDNQSEDLGLVLDNHLEDSSVHCSLQPDQMDVTNVTDYL
jgi:hypothetical protein